jgi:hypothetical protein
MATCRPLSWSASAAGLVVNSLVFLFQEISPPLNFWEVTSPL